MLDTKQTTQSGSMVTKQAAKALFASAFAALFCTLFATSAQAHPERKHTQKKQAVQCAVSYTSCVLSCNKQGVTYAQKANNANTVQSKARWKKALMAAQVTCIPQCYRVHCLGQAPHKAKRHIARK